MKTILSVLILLSSVTFAVDLKPTAVFNQTKLDVSPALDGTTLTTRDGISGGLLVEIPLALSASFETGVLASYYGYKADVAALDYSVTYKWLMAEVPMVFRFRVLGPLSIGLGGFVAMSPNGKVKTTETLAGVTTESDGDLSTNAKMDYGVLGSVGLKVPMGKGFGMFADVRYQLGLKNQAADSATTVKVAQTRVMGGFFFTL